MAIDCQQRAYNFPTADLSLRVSDIQRMFCFSSHARDYRSPGSCEGISVLSPPTCSLPKLHTRFSQCRHSWGSVIKKASFAAVRHRMTCAQEVIITSQSVVSSKQAHLIPSTKLGVSLLLILKVKALFPLDMFTMVDCKRF